MAPPEVFASSVLSVPVREVLLVVVRIAVDKEPVSCVVELALPVLPTIRAVGSFGSILKCFGAGQGLCTGCYHTSAVSAGAGQYSGIHYPFHW